MQWSNHTFSHLITHRNWQKQTTHPFLACPKTTLKWYAETMWYIGMYTPEAIVFSGFVLHLVSDVYHKPCPPAAGNLVFADSAHSRSLWHPSVKSREQTQSMISLLQKTICLFVCFIRNQCLVTHSKSCAPCLGFKDLHQRMGSLAFQLNLSPLQPGPEPSLDPVSSLVSFSC